ncbi:MAG TPA: YfhO family protein [Chloroflexota bacterium]|nr:YfhO family protein [Chloroflexota bacterium]
MGAIVALAAYAALLLRATLLRGGAMAGFDLFTYFYPTKQFALDSLRRGVLPLWNPLIFFGAPFLANIQMGVLYPPNLVFLLSDFAHAVALSQWLHLTLGGAGMYALCRMVWRLGHLPSLAGAMAFAGGGFFGAHMGHLNQVHAGVWLPWIALAQFSLARGLGAADTALTRHAVVASGGWIAAGGAAVALQLSAGHTQEAYYSILSLALLALGFTVLPPRWAPDRRAHLPAFALVVANGALLAAAQLVPTVELSGLSYRQGGVALEEAVAFGVERTYLLESLLPTFWSLPAQEVTGYVGVTALALAAAAVASRARRTVVALMALALFSVTLTLGAYTPLFPLLHRWLPLFGSFRAPGRWLLVSSFALAGLAAHGLDALHGRETAVARERAARRFALTAAAIGGGIVLAAWRSELVHAVHWLPHSRVAVLWLGAALGTVALALAAVSMHAWWPRAALVAGLGVELVFASREMEYNRPITPELYRTPPEVTASVGSSPMGDGAPVRVLSLAVEERLDPERLRRAVPDGDGERRRYTAMAEVLRPDLGMAYGLPTIDGYDGGLLPLKSFATLKALLVGGEETAVPHYTLAPQAPARPDARLFGSLGVRFLLTDGRAGPPGTGWRALDSAPGVAEVYENADVAPRAFVVRDVIAEPAPERTVALLRTLDLRRSAVIERPVAGLGNDLPRSDAPSGVPARVTSYAAGSIEIDASGPGLLVMTETFYPGWRATVDGAAAPIVRADLHFRGVPLAAGSHRVRLWYDPLSFKVGVALAVLAIVLNLALLWRARPYLRRR